MFDFPSSPSEGQIFAAPGGPTYIFNTPTWRAIGQGQIAVVSDGPPANPANGTLWFESDTGNLFVSYNDGSSTQWVQVSGSAQAALTAESRNRIVNGAMQISQETAKGTGLSVNGSYIADQFALGVSTTGAPLAVVTNAPDPYIQLWASTANAAPAAGHYFQLYQPIEGIRVSDLLWGTVSAKPVVVRFEAQSSIVGTATFSLSNDTGAVTYLKNFTFTQANVWQTFTIAVPGATTGTWKTDNTSSFVVHWCVMAGSGPRGGVEGWQAGSFIATSSTSNWMSVAGQTFQIRNVGLHLDPLATGIAPSWTMPDEAEELQACKRYWERLGSYSSLWMGNATSGQGYTAGFCWQVSKRAAPAVTGVTVAQSGFPTTTGVCGVDGVIGGYENRVSNAAHPAGFFHSVITGNARM